MSFGRITAADCVNVAPPPDQRCQDPAFSLANPDICFTAPTLVIKPSFALVCALGSIQFRAFYVKNGVETDVTSQSVFTSSNQTVALVGAASGNATGIALGKTNIIATYQNLTAQTEMNVLGDNCCADRTVAMMLAVDTSRSMSQAFGGGYSTRLDYAKAAATRFINEVNQTKDIVGLMHFNATDDVVLSAPTSDKASVAALVPGIVQTQNLTTFYDALNTAIGELNATSSVVKVLVLLSDGEDDTDSYLNNPNPIQLLSDFKAQGGIVICFGCRASGKGFNLLSALSTGGFFINGYPANAQQAISYLSGLKGYICAGNCTPAGDVKVATGQLDYNAFLNWDVILGPSGADPAFDLQGNGFFDWLPGNGLYVNLGRGNNFVDLGNILRLKTAINLQASHTYRVTVRLAGPQIPNIFDPLEGESVSTFLRVFDSTTNADLLNQTITIDDFKQPFVNYSFSFTAASATAVKISLQQKQGRNNGVLLKRVTFEDTTDALTMFDDKFDTENIKYVPPACGIGTTYVYLPSSVQTLLIDKNWWDFYIQSGPFTPDITIWTPATDGQYIVRVTMSTNPHNGYPPGAPQYIRSVITYTDLSGNPQSVQPAPDMHMDADVREGSASILCKAGTPIVLVVTGNAVGDTLNGFFQIAAAVYSVGPGYGYAKGYNCYGYGCLDTPPPSQLPDPNPLPDIEQGFTPPKTYTSTKTACATCPPSTINSGSGLIPVMTSFTLPSGVASSSSTGGRLAWMAFDDPTSVNPGWDSDHAAAFPQWLAYTFDTAKVATAVGIRAISRIFPVTAPQGYNDLHWQLQGSTDGASWTTLTEGTGNSATFGIAETQYGFVNSTAYRYYRLYFPNDSTNTTGYAIVYRMQLYGSDSGQVCKSATETSLVSQQDADTKAYNSALALANAALNCTHVFSSTQSYTAHCPSNQFGPPVTKSATATSLVDQATADATALAAATAAANAALVCNLSNNDQAITINDHAAASPYPSVKNVTGLTGHITKVTVNIKKFSHTFPDDVELVLVAPDGTTRVVLMANCGGSNVIAPGVAIDLVFDDAAGSSLPDSTILSSGTFKPTTYPTIPQLPSPGPALPYSATLAAFIGMAASVANGSWALYCYDDSAANTGLIAQGWDLTITSA